MDQFPAQIDRVIAQWASRQPSFLWAPTSRDKLLLDRARGLKARALGKAAAIQPGGIPTLIPNSGDSWIEFPTNAGVTGGLTPFVGVMLVSATDPAALTGCLLKIGSDANGIGFGVGNTTFEDSGTKGICLQEAVAWQVGSANFLAAGLNVISFGITSDGITALFCHTTQVDAGFNAATTIAPSAQLRINGYFTSRGSNVKVHAVGIFLKSLDALSTGAFQAERERLVLPARGIQRISRAATDALFATRRTFVPGAAAAGGSSATITPAAGASTASTLVGRSTVAATITPAAGVSTTQTLVGVSGSGSTITPAAGSSTTSTLTGRATAAAAMTPAAGVSTASTLTGRAGAAASITPAAGQSTTSTLTPFVPGTSTMTPAAGISTSSTLVGRSTARATLTAAAGASTTGTLFGTTAEAAEDFSVTLRPPARGINVFGLISPVAGYASASIFLPDGVDRQEVLVHCRQPVAALTVQPVTGQHISGAPAALAAPGFFRLRFDGRYSLWCRIA